MAGQSWEVIKLEPYCLLVMDLRVSDKPSAWAEGTEEQESAGPQVKVNNREHATQ